MDYSDWGLLKMNFIIREMNRDDIKQVQNVAKVSWNSTYEGIIPVKIQENFLQLAYSDEMMEKRLTKSIMCVAEIENKILGFANFSPVNNEGESELSAIYLHPNYQKNGIGTALLEHGITTLKHVKKIYIDVEKDNKLGRIFYQAKGFKTIKEFDDDFDGHILKTVRMCLNL